MGKLDGKVAAITGAGGGIGRALFCCTKTEEVSDLKIRQIGREIGEAEQRQLPGMHARTIANGCFSAKNVQIAGSIGNRYRNVEMAAVSA